MNTIRVGLVAAALLAWAIGAAAQPAKPLRIVVAFPAGGPIDIVARMLAPKLSEVLGQAVLVENRAGANGIIGTDHVAKSPPDGQTAILASVSAVAISPAVYPKMPYDPMRDLATVTLVSTTPELLVVHPSVPAKSMKELIALAKSRPNQLNIASTGSGGLPHLALELLKTASKSELLHVPYNGAAPSVSALLGGQAPKTPRETVSRLHESLVKTLNDAGVREKMIARGADPVGNTPEQFADYLRQDIERWARLAKSTNIKVD